MKALSRASTPRFSKHLNQHTGQGRARGVLGQARTPYRVSHEYWSPDLPVRSGSAVGGCDRPMALPCPVRHHHSMRKRRLGRADFSCSLS